MCYKCYGNFKTHRYENGLYHNQSVIDFSRNHVKFSVYQCFIDAL